jgi:hypothetical protein
MHREERRRREYVKPLAADVVHRQKVVDIAPAPQNAQQQKRAVLAPQSRTKIQFN